MDVCHVLLGRPWLYDRRVIHDGYLNTYSFVKDGKKITLTPLASHQMATTKPSKPTESNEKLFTLVEADLKASQHEFMPFKDWILQTILGQDKIPSIPP